MAEAGPTQPPPSPLAVDARFRFTLWDVFRASSEASRHSWVAACFGFFLVYGTFFYVQQADPVSIAFVVVGFGFATGWLSAAFIVFGMSRRRDLLDREHVVHADPLGISWVAPGSTSQGEWRLYRRVRDMRSDFLLDPGTGASTFVPKRALGPDGTAAFRELVRGAGLLSEGSSWTRPLIGCAVGVVACLLLYLATSAAFGR